MCPKREVAVSRAARANHKCPIIMEFENGSLQEFVGQEPITTVYLAPIGWDITRKTVLTTKSFALYSGRC